MLYFQKPAQGFMCSDPVLFVRQLRLTSAMTSSYNSNPSNSPVINKAHIVAEGERGEVWAGEAAFTLMDMCFEIRTGLQEGLREGMYSGNSEDFSESETLFSPFTEHSSSILLLFLSPNVSIIFSILS